MRSSDARPLVGADRRMKECYEAYCSRKSESEDSPSPGGTPRGGGSRRNPTRLVPIGGSTLSLATHPTQLVVSRRPQCLHIMPAPGCSSVVVCLLPGDH
ncbi:hypothetical protein SLA2020_416460 [Shorea laevis]